jgi:hypothetical protein
LGNQFLANIRDVNAICHVVRAFDSHSVVRIGEGVGPAADIETLETELALADLQTIEKRLPRLEREATVDRALRPKVDLLRLLQETVGSGQMVSRDPEVLARYSEAADLHLLTAKPIIYVFNSDPSLLVDYGRRSQLAKAVAPAEALFLDAQIEAELNDLEAEDRAEMLESVGQEEPGLNAVIRAAYRTLGLQSYLTVGDKEARAWTIRCGATAPQAAGVIHTDFELGFIAAEVVDFPLLIEAGSWVEARARGAVRTEGRSYVMRPDDVVEFRFNV